VRFGLSIPNFAPFDDLRQVTELAREAEANGWDGFFLWDHIHLTQRPMLDPWVALASIAVATERIRIGTMVTPVARRRPWKLARETVTLDHLSGGRLILGVGLGHPPEPEFAAFGEETDDGVRARRLDEGLDVLAGLWSGEPFSYQGEEFTVEGALFLPKPVQQPRIPVWVAGVWPHRAPMRRAARWDGAFPMQNDPATGQLVWLAPRDVEEILAFVREQRDPDAPFDLAIGRPLRVDDPQRARDLVAELEAAGATWWMESAAGPDDLRERIRQRPLGA